MDCLLTARQLLTECRAGFCERRGSRLHIYICDSRITTVRSNTAMFGEMDSGKKLRYLIHCMPMLIFFKNLRERRSYAPISSASAEES